MLCDLPVEMLEAVLMKAFLMLYQRDFETGDDRRPYKRGKSSSSEHRAFTLLGSVCWSWYYGLTGWPHSPTRLWVRHKLRKSIEREYWVMYLGCQQIRFLVVIDTIGAPRQNFFVWAKSAAYDRRSVNDVWPITLNIGIGTNKNLVWCV